MEIQAGHRPVISVGPPPEFGGRDTWWSPEHLLVSATATCFVATFVAMAERANLRVGRIQCHATGSLDRTKDGIAFTSVDLALVLSVLTDETDRARKLVDEAKRHCFVAKSLRCPVEVTAEVTAS
jgi:peroxiredoxin-like protein